MANNIHLATLQLTSIAGTPLTAIHLPPGTYAGYPAAVSDQPLVEFYDTRFNHTIFGQFTGGRYHRETLIKHPMNGGLALDGNVRAWTISPAEFAKVRAWLRDLKARD